MSGKREGIQETPQQAAMADLAMRQLQDYRQRWAPLQRQLADQVVKMGVPDSFERRQARGVASTDRAIQFGAAAPKVIGATAQRGTGRLGSSAGKLAVAGMGEDQATSTALGLVGAERQIDDAYVAGLSQIMALGRGQRSAAVQGQADVAAMSGRQARADAQISLESRMGDAQLAGQFVGMGLTMPGRPGGVSGINDLNGVNGQNAMDTWLRSGVGGD